MMKDREEANSKKHSTTSRWSVRLAGTLDMIYTTILNEVCKFHE